jgi:hypothetical protein
MWGVKSNMIALSGEPGMLISFLPGKLLIIILRYGNIRLASDTLGKRRVTFV